MVQLYNFFRTIWSELPKNPQWQELRKCLPKSVRSYIDDYNIDQFISPLTSPEKKRYSQLESNRKDVSQFDQQNDYNAGAQEADAFAV